MNYTKLYGKHIVKVNDGMIIGKVCDIAFDPCHYHLEAIYACVPLCGFRRFFPMLFQKEAIEVMIDDIVSIEGDVILIR